jgi:transcriptional regulator with XRE-family HTH domain
MNTLGEKLRKLREEKQVTIMDINRLTGVAVGTIGDIERGKIQSPSIFTMEKIAKALKVSPLIFMEDPDLARDSVTEDISYLYDNEYLNLFRDPDFQKYFNCAKRAYAAGISPESLAMMVDALIMNRNARKDMAAGNQ